MTINDYCLCVYMLGGLIAGLLIVICLYAILRTHIK